MGSKTKKVRLRFAPLRMTAKVGFFVHSALIDSNINSHSIAFSFDTRGAKEKASQKEKRRFSLSLFEKSSAKTFLDRSLRDVQSTRWLWVSYVCAHYPSMLTSYNCPNNLSASLAAACSASLFERPSPFPITFEFNIATTEKVLL